MNKLPYEIKEKIAMYAAEEYNPYIYNNSLTRDYSKEFIRLVQEPIGSCMFWHDVDMMLIDLNARYELAHLKREIVRIVNILNEIK